VGEAGARPLLRGLDAEGRRAKLGELLARREPDYARADLVVDVDDADLETVVARLASRLAGPA
jgi:shikimate kinase